MSKTQYFKKMQEKKQTFNKEKNISDEVIMPLAELYARVTTDEDYFKPVNIETEKPKIEKETKLGGEEG